MNIAEERGTIPACPQCGATAPRIALDRYEHRHRQPGREPPAAAWKCIACDQKWETGP